MLSKIALKKNISQQVDLNIISDIKKHGYGSYKVEVLGEKQLLAITINLCLKNKSMASSFPTNPEVVWGRSVKLDVDVNYAQKGKMVEDSQRHHMISYHNMIFID